MTNLELLIVLSAARTTLNRCVSETMTHSLRCMCADVVGNLEAAEESIVEEEKGMERKIELCN